MYSTSKACRIKLIAKTMKEDKVGMLRTKHIRDLFMSKQLGFPECI